jgi:7-carboxy-7-deazaguanine synthase (Cx14CxxC type)
MSYSVKEIYYTLQGEGANTGRPAVFCRFAGCNLWSGLEQERTTAKCRFCDTNFVGTDGPGGGRFKTAQELVAAITCEWTSHARDDHRRFVVCTGGEPMLQMDDVLICALHAAGFEIAVETNGTLPVPSALDWICVSPKAGAKLTVRVGNELKLVYPQEGAPPTDFDQLNFRHFFLQPMDGPFRDENTRLAMEYCLKYPKWRLSLQTHKLLGIP